MILDGGIRQQGIDPLLRLELAELRVIGVLATPLLQQAAGIFFAIEHHEHVNLCDDIRWIVGRFVSVLVQSQRSFVGRFRGTVAIASSNVVRPSFTFKMLSWCRVFMPLRIAIFFNSADSMPLLIPRSAPRW
jgi:hypothetical protein